MAPCQQVPSLWQTGNVSSIAVGEGYTCELYEADNCTSEPYSIQSPGESDLGLRTIKRISCAQAALEKSGSLDDIHYDL
ncbi:hypothetical protein BDV25DRAFT_145616 [Aspergillus avenaceus]|uniref:Uncharacterized protein n=1 Tax=Aspergillus avenaceus TaxID=36643 RepID=A0A5N6TDJ5_ASPAV|nr:hypothetical protein BDV25DRAFT_145616 [Aspergillus avenaceus]